LAREAKHAIIAPRAAIADGYALNLGPQHGRYTCRMEDFFGRRLKQFHRFTTAAFRLVAACGVLGHIAILDEMEERE
jgi:hypothetical protein